MVDTHWSNMNEKLRGGGETLFVSEWIKPEARHSCIHKMFRAGEQLENCKVKRLENGEQPDCLHLRTSS